MKTQYCTPHPVPENRFGITTMHTPDNLPIPVCELQGFFDGPMALVHKQVVEDCDRVEELP
jgi:hypothetical protein